MKIPSTRNPLIDEDEEFLLDSVKGRSGAKRKMAILNKQKLRRDEMDALFLPEEKE